MERKWEWIRRVCEERGYFAAAVIGEEIDRALLQIYGDQSAEGWVQYYKEHQFKCENPTDTEIMEVAESPGLCIACECSTCETCVFASVYGRCRHESSLYQKFLIEIEEAAYKGEK